MSGATSVQILQVGERYQLDNTSPAAATGCPQQDFKVGLGWAPLTCFAADVDSAAIAVDATGQFVGRATMGSSKIPGVIHNGDNLSGSDEKSDEDESITVKLDGLSSNIHTIYFTASVFAVCPLYCLPVCFFPIASFLFIPTAKAAVSGVTNGEYFKFASTTFDTTTMSCWERTSPHIVLGGITRREGSTSDAPLWDFVSVGRPVKSWCCCCHSAGDIPLESLPNLRREVASEGQSAAAVPPAVELQRQSDGQIPHNRA